MIMKMMKKRKQTKMVTKMTEKDSKRGRKNNLTDRENNSLILKRKNSKRCSLMMFTEKKPTYARSSKLKTKTNTT